MCKKEDFQENTIYKKWNNFVRKNYGWMDYGIHEINRRNKLLKEVKENLYDVLNEKVIDYCGDLKNEMEECVCCGFRDIFSNDNFELCNNFNWCSICVKNKFNGCYICKDCINNKENEKYLKTLDGYGNKIGVCCVKNYKYKLYNN